MQRLTKILAFVAAMSAFASSMMLLAVVKVGGLPSSGVKGFLRTQGFSDAHIVAVTTSVEYCEHGHKITTYKYRVTVTAPDGKPDEVMVFIQSHPKGLESQDPDSHRPLRNPNAVYSL